MDALAAYRYRDEVIAVLVVPEGIHAAARRDGPRTNRGG
jgi:hypothetical protein